MIKRLNIYFKEMHPLPSRFLAGLTIFFQIYFLVLLTNGNKSFSIDVSDLVGGFTLFAYLLLLRIADDLKDETTDARLFPDRPIPSGRTGKKDLQIVGILVLIAIIVLNVIFMNNLLYFIVLIVYGILMTVWFFNKKVIQNSLPLALVTHNPVQIVMNIYVISFTCIKYGINLITFSNFLIIFALYFDGLAWEIARKVRAPKDETEYVTYSKLFGYRKVVNFVLIIMFIECLITCLLIYELFAISVIGRILGYFWFIYKCKAFNKDPERFSMKSLMEKYLCFTEPYVIVVIVLYLLLNVF